MALGLQVKAINKQIKQTDTDAQNDDLFPFLFCLYFVLPNVLD